MLYIREAHGSVDEVAQKLTAATAAQKYGVLGIHDLKAKMAEKGVSFGPQCRIFEVCNPQQVKKVLEANMAVANALPCRICIYEEDGKVKVSTLKPTAVLALFGTESLRGVAAEVETTITRIIDEACR